MVKSVVIRRLVFVPGTALIIMISFLTYDTLPLNELLAHIVKAIGAITLYVSLALALAIHRSYPKRHDSPRDFKELLTRGPYRLCRHPFYLLTMIAQISIAIVALSIWGIATALLMIPLWLYLIRLEEQELISYWGEEYVRYMKETPMLIPRLRKLDETEQ
ncbi:MAG: isoprenylcysteine carboxylmethyltransferase family protein [Crenarchaeota archaeon]|nr:isoprenylcysteine carboxylmethyltransferase family protein [Thermoproteota archaeon]